MTAPSFISATATAFNTTSVPKTTASIAVQNGDILVAYTMVEQAIHGTMSISTASGSTSAWTLQEETPNGLASNTYMRMWSATATANGNITVTFTYTVPNTDMHGGIVKVWRGSNGIGNVNRNNNGTGSGAPTISLTTTGANSGIDYGSSDWNATAGTATFVASNGTPVSDLVDQTTAGSNYCNYSFHVVDAGAAGSKTMGMSAPSTQRYLCTAIEILGTGGGGATLRARSSLQSMDSGFVRLEQARSSLHPIDDGFVAHNGVWRKAA